MKAPVTNVALLDYIKATPNCTNKQIAAKFGLDANSVAARTRKFEQQGRVKRHKVGTTLAGVAILGHTFITYGTDPKRGRKPKGTNPFGKESSSHAKKASYYYAEEAADPVTEQPKSSIHESLMALSAALADAIVGQVKNKLAVELSSLLPDPVPQAQLKLPSFSELQERITLHTPEKKTQLPRIGICGLLPQQEGLISSEFGDCFDLQFFNDRSGGGTDKLKSMAKSSEVVLIHTNHASHNWQDAVKSAGGKVKLVGGGMTQMRNMLTEMFVGAQYV